MDKPKLLIADYSEDFRVVLAQALEPYYQVLCCQDGKEALNILRRETPQVLILDPMLPELDGISLLKTAIRENIRPMVLMAAVFLSDYIQESASQLGVGYILQKPCSIPAAVARIRELDSRLHPLTQDPRTQICQILFSLSVSAKHDGFLYLLDAIELMSHALGQPVTKVIYPKVARMYGCTPGNVERSIRSALTAAWKQRNIDLWLQYFPFHSQHPSNADFITRIAMSLQMHDQDGMI